MQALEQLSRRGSVARELFGVMHAKGARKAVLATSGRLTAEAQRFCRDNAIYWLDADRLPGFIDPQAMPPQAEIAADRGSRCPLCSAVGVRSCIMRLSTWIQLPTATQTPFLRTS